MPESVRWRVADRLIAAACVARELTKKGRKQAERMAKWLKPRLEGDWRVLASPAKLCKTT